MVNVDKLTYAGNPESLANVADSPRYQCEQVDIGDALVPQRVFDAHQPDAETHLAAESHVGINAQRINVQRVTSDWQPSRITSGYAVRS